MADTLSRHHHRRKISEVRAPKSEYGLVFCDYTCQPREMAGGMPVVDSLFNDCYGGCQAAELRFSVDVEGDDGGSG